MPQNTIPDVATDISPNDAIAFQNRMADRVIHHDVTDRFDTVTGVDVAYDRESDRMVAAVVTLDAETLDVLETAHHTARATFPYIPGLFSFREMPPILAAIGKLGTPPELVICDGQGIAHPRRFGLASHLGTVLQVPAIGCAKTRFFGTQVGDIGPLRGDTAPLADDAGTVLGAVLRTQDNTRPVFVSTGHMICLETACDRILKCAPKYRLPETTRQADQACRAALKKTSGSPL